MQMFGRKERNKGKAPVLRTCSDDGSLLRFLMMLLTLLPNIAKKKAAERKRKKRLQSTLFYGDAILEDIGHTRAALLNGKKSITKG
ncbi:hypothetical protein [Vibrio salinus]|uniref:hypothetical protein n=1 Tax=Vibrio salinus TaxID=2899784 RepID=UPI001E389996|nr:hypothetical protein [Vibrio salinus]MCE0496025.1 hypothetical protein [Vibrio salinus]